MIPNVRICEVDIDDGVEGPSLREAGAALIPDRPGYLRGGRARPPLARRPALAPGRECPPGRVQEPAAAGAQGHLTLQSLKRRKGVAR